MHNLRFRLADENTVVNKLKAALSQLGEILQIRDLYYVDDNGRMRAVVDTSFDSDAGDISQLMKDDVYAERTLERAEAESPKFYGALKSKGLASALAVRFRCKCTHDVYRVCAVERSYRIWQENEKAILYYLAGLLEDFPLA